MSSLKVINLIQNNYIYHYKLHTYKKKKSIVPTILIFVLSISILYSVKIFSYSYSEDIISTISYIQNPIDPLYSDMGDIVFTSMGEKVVLKTSLEFKIPVIYNTYLVNDNNIEFEVASPIIYSMEKGVVSDIYVIGNNIKCVKIKHNKNTYSVIENVDILGVNIGAFVDKGQKIGTAKIGDKIRVYIEKSSEYKSLSITGNNICIN